jgi:hypothetical protein
VNGSGKKQVHRLIMREKGSLGFLVYENPVSCFLGSMIKKKKKVRRVPDSPRLFFSI